MNARMQPASFALTDAAGGVSGRRDAGPGRGSRSRAPPRRREAGRDSQAPAPVARPGVAVAARDRRAALSGAIASRPSSTSRRRPASATRSASSAARRCCCCCVYPARKRVRALRLHRHDQALVPGAHGARHRRARCWCCSTRISASAPTNSNVALACMLVVSGQRTLRPVLLHAHPPRPARPQGQPRRAQGLRRQAALGHDQRRVPAGPRRAHRVRGARDRRSLRSACRCSRGRRSAPSASRSRAVACVATCAQLAAHVASATAVMRRAGARPAARRPTGYIDDRLAATRRVVEFAAFERLFSLWHALHLPLFLMLLIAGVVHVVAVHVY